MLSSENIVISILRRPRTFAVLVVGAGIFIWVAAASGAPHMRLTARGNELARTTNLRVGDFPASFSGGFVPGRPGTTGCGSNVAPDTGLTATGFAEARFGTPRVQIVSTVTILRDPSETSLFFRRVEATFTSRCAMGAFVANGRMVSARRLRPQQAIAHSLSYTFVVRRGAATYAAELFLLGEGRIMASLVVEEKGSRISTSSARLALSLLVSRIED